MNTSSIESKIEYLSDIPESIQRGLLNLFGIQAIDELTKEKKILLKNSISRLFSTTEQTDYDEYCRAYALYYLPVNMQKIWRPLLDLAITDSLESSCRVLELGAGPGSATFGLIAGSFMGAPLGNHLVVKKKLAENHVEQEHFELSEDIVRVADVSNYMKATMLLVVAVGSGSVIRF